MSRTTPPRGRSTVPNRSTPRPDTTNNRRPANLPPTDLLTTTDGRSPELRYLEVRPGEGGADEAVFATELLQALEAYVRRRGATATPVNQEGRTMVLAVRDAPGDLDRFSGTHRIQRIPAGERSGRRHTSTATVAVLDHHDQVRLEVADRELRVDTYRGSGAGGQHRNKTSTAVRLTHLPTGTVVTAEQSRSQGQNLAAARAELVRRLSAAQGCAQAGAQAATRAAQIASGERPVKQWTWNTQRNQVVDHTSGATYPLRACFRGRFGD